ncbi:hypothetical protein AcV5_002012 [Taiwanofungus camphoratus]|nr:hypothetical protein AcV5_002012 [Antrodia cinnamomea]
MFATTSSPPGQRCPSVKPWKPWSVPVDPNLLQRKLCGLLNKITAVNFDGISNKVVKHATSIERGGDPANLNVLAFQILRQGISDATRVEVYGSLCQKIMDELEGDRIRWRRVDLYHLGDPIHSFEAAMQVHTRREFDCIIAEGRLEDLHALTRFLGELLVHGVLTPEDVEGIISFLLVETEKNNEDCAVALCRFLLRVFRAPDASRIFNALAIAEGLERVLQEDSISLKIRYSMMKMLELALDPEPLDTFNSTQLRTEAYGLDPELDEQNALVTTVGELVQSEATNSLRSSCQEQATSFFMRRKLAPAESFLSTLKPKHRHCFVTSLVSFVLSSSDQANASLVALLFSLDTVRRLCREENSFVKGFESEVFTLDDTVLDVPHAYQLTVIMLYACGLSQDVVEKLASRIAATGSDGGDRLLEEYFTLANEAEIPLEHGTAYYSEVSYEYGSDSDAERGAMEGSDSERQVSSSDVGYAY